MEFQIGLLEFVTGAGVSLIGYAIGYCHGHKQGTKDEAFRNQIVLKDILERQKYGNTRPQDDSKKHG